ncbi:hypothetical protein [Streptomyces sp. NBC_00328]|uniref:hypothetical protein n=1 Tax=Streptomyces sp. NBC_00328 TaxID=2903646 RepID=UPI002E2B86DB|nr:hypothetical protein [Streptomyces sp. NBC_00328]
MKGRAALSATVGLVVIGVVSANADGNSRGHGRATGGADRGSSVSTTPYPGTRQHTGSADAAEKGKASFAGNGDFRVGPDIEPGTYRTTGNTDGSCHWERAEDAGHGLDSLIAEGDVTGTAVVTISAKDTYFKTSGCGDWKKTGRRTPRPPD